MAVRKLSSRSYSNQDAKKAAMRKIAEKMENVAICKYMKRHPELSIRKPEATSIGRTAAFNRHNVDQFYANVRHVLAELELRPHQIWNCDETGVTTVQVPERVIAGRGDRQDVCW